MSSVLVSDLITRVRYKTNMERSQFVTDAELLFYINDSRKILFDKLVAGEADETYNLTEATVTIDQTTGEGSLPEDFFIMRKVYEISGNTVAREIRSISIAEYTEGVEGVYQGVTPFWHASGASFVLFNNKIKIVPYSSIEEIKIWYNAKPAELTATSDTINLLYNEDSWIIAWCCIQVARKEESATGAFEKELAYLEKSIIGALKPRQRSIPRQVARVRHKYRRR